MKRFFLLSLLGLAALSGFAQNTTASDTIVSAPNSYSDVKNNDPLVRFHQYVAVHYNYPTEAINNQIEGKIIVDLTINSNGELEKVILFKGLCDACDQEALRVVTSYHDFKSLIDLLKDETYKLRIPIYLKLDE